jgi:Uma2 family endonuclease
METKPAMIARRDDEAKPSVKSFSPSDYLRFERASQTKHEYFQGKIVAMAGTSLRHTLVANGANVSLSFQLRGKRCYNSMNDLRVVVPLANSYFYPDIVMICGEPVLTDDKFDTLTNPSLIIEVLSPSTEKKDRGQKFIAYQTLATLQDYLLISQDQPRIEHYTRQDNGWFLQSYAQLTDVVELPNVECRLPLADVYERITFDKTPEELMQEAMNESLDVDDDD